MKKLLYVFERKLIILLCVLMSVSFSGCADEAGNVEKKDNNATMKVENNVDNVKKAENAKIADISGREIAFEVVTNCDYNKLAMNFSELVSASDLIVKVKVQDTRAFINDEGMIQTEISPKILETYKGIYDGQKLYVNGGEMLYEEYSGNEIVKKLVAGHENPNADEENTSKYVRQNVDNQYIFYPGDEYIFFASRREDNGLFFSQYAYQGTFKVSNGVVENIAVTGEPLQENISEIFSGNQNRIIGEDEFTEQIKKELGN